LRTASVAAGALLALGALAGPTLAQPTADCDAVVAKQLRKVTKTGQKNQDKCHKLANKICVGSEGVCNDPDSVAFQIVDKTKYELTKAAGLLKIGEECTPANLDQYPDDNVANMTEFIDDLIANRAELVIGDENLGCDEGAVTCFSTISKQRGALADKMLNAAIKCQGGEAPGSALASTCLDSSVIQSAIDKANTKITEDCTGLTGADVGSCDPLPACVTAAAVAEGRTAATRIYPAENCGASPTADARTASIDIDTPADLGGLTIEMDYPRYAMGLPENGSAIDFGDLSNFTVAFLTPFDLDGTLRISAADFNPISSGQLVDVKFDTCLPLALGTCNLDGARACNGDFDCKICVAGTNPGANCTTNANCTGGGTCTGTEGPCNLTNGFCSFSQFTQCPGTACPTGESCVAQQTLATCRVTDASDTFGNPVDGVTCTATLSEP
jgi:hypothetical protein